MSDGELLPHLRFATSLEATLDEVWHRLSRGVKDRRSAMRHPTLATVDGQGCAAMRTVVLRAASRNDARLTFHTDWQSAKIAEIEQQPNVSLHVWDESCKLQLRISAVARIITGDDAETAWHKVPEGSRAAYGAVPAPGTSIHAADAFAIEPSADRFAVIECELKRIETLCLTPVQHYRAVFDKADGWSGQWLVP